MTIAASFIFNQVKEVMLGSSANSIGVEGLTSLSLTSSVRAMLILANYDAAAGMVASTTTSIRSVFSSRVPTGNAAYGSQSADMALTTPVVSDSTNGVVHFDADDGVFAGSVSTGGVIAGILIYKAVAGLDASSYPIAVIAITTVTANGASININWDNGVNRIFALT